jgi:hypothetical protein
MMLLSDIRDMLRQYFIHILQKYSQKKRELLHRNQIYHSNMLINQPTFHNKNNIDLPVV